MRTAPVLCRWIPVRADAEVWGLRGDYIHALVRKRVVGYVTRGRDLLVFEHAGVLQVPAGRIDHDETLEEGLLREVEEETGVTGLRVVGVLADADEVDRLYGVLGTPIVGLPRRGRGRRPGCVGAPCDWNRHGCGNGLPVQLGAARRCVHSFGGSRIPWQNGSALSITDP